MICLRLHEKSFLLEETYKKIYINISEEKKETGKQEYL